MSNINDALKNDILNFIDRIDEILEDHSIIIDEFVGIKFYFSIMSPEQVMNHVVQYILPHKAKIKSRADNFFYKNKMIFGDLPESQKYLDYLSDVWTNDFDIEDKEEVWEFFDIFVMYAEKFLTLKKE